MSSLDPGQNLLHYRVLEKLGEGGMGVVYKAEDLKLGRHVAIKVLPPEARKDETARRRLLQEARAASALNHPNIVTIHAIEEAESLDFFVMEYVAGESLSARIQRGPLELASLVELGIQLADALAVAHSAGLTHRDIKSSNILLTPRGQAKLLDFGLAKRAGPLPGAVETDETLTAVLTKPGMILGTVAYMSPEQTRGEPLDGQSDIFSLGSVLYEAATGRLPFRGPSMLAILHEIATVDPPPPRAVRPDLPLELDRILGRALAKDKARRYASASDLAGALRGLETPAAMVAPVVKEPEPETFVGRESEIRKLDELLRGAVEGAGQIVFLTGEPGIGKTALAGAFLRRVRQSHPGALIGRGRCVEQYGTGEAYLPFLDAMAGLLAGPARDRVASILRVHAPTWCLQFPAAFASTGDLDRLQRETIGATKQRMLREMGDALGALAAGSPVVLLLEDLHWADPSSADLLGHLGQRAAGQRLLVLGTFRPEDVERGNHPLKNYKREMQAHRRCEEIALEVLSRQDVARYLDARFAPHDFPAELAELIHRRTEGHALFATSLVQFLMDRADVTRTNGRWTLARPAAELDLEAPDNVRSLIRKQIEALEEEDRRALQYASVEGEEFTSTVLAALLGAEEVALEERLARLERAHRLIRTLGEEELPDGSLATRYRFSHALFQNVLYAELVPKRRTLLHRQAAEEVLRRYGTQAATRLAMQLATHFERGRDFPRAVEYLTQAGDNAARLYANAVAEEHYTHALQLVDKLPTEQLARAQAGLYQKRGAVKLTQARFLQAEEDFTSVLDRARAMGDAEMECRALNSVAHSLFWMHRTEEMLARATEALQVAERIGNQALRIESMANLALGHQGKGELDEDIALLEEVIPIARSMQHKPTLAAALTYRCIAHFFQTEYERAEEAGVEAVRLASELRDGLHLVVSLFFVGLSRGNLGRMSDAIATIREAMELTRRNGNLSHFCRLPNSLGWIHHELQDFDHSIEHDQESVAIARQNRVVEAEINSLLNLAGDYRQAGESEKSLPALQEAERLSERDPWHRWRFLGIRFHASSAEHWLAEGNLEQAAEHARRLLDNATRHRVRKYIAVSHKLLAAVEAARGNPAGAERELLAGLEALRDHPAPLVAWKIHAALGRLGLHTGDRDRAREAFGEAAGIVQQIAANVTDERLRDTFLNSAAVQEVLNGSK